MTALEILEKCRNGGQEILELEISLAMRRDALARCGAEESCSAAREQLMREIGQLSDALEARRCEYSAEVCAGVWIVERLPMALRPVMRGWYLDRKSMSRLSKDTHYSTTSVRRLRKKGKSACAGIEESAVAARLPDWYLERK